MSVSVRLRNEVQLRKALRRLNGDMRAAGVEALRTWGKETRDTARSTVQVLSGYLRSTIRYRVNAKRLEAEAGTRDELAHYGTWLEDGNSRQKPQPFLGPAAEESNRQMQGWLRESVRRRLP